MGKKNFLQTFADSPYLRPKYVHEIFFKMNLHLKDLFLGIFDFKNGFPDLKKTLVPIFMYVFS